MKFREYLKEKRIMKFKEYLAEVKSPSPLGTIWSVKAKLYDKDQKEIGYCMDTPNAIAKAFMEWPKAMFVKPFGEAIKPRSLYKDRMSKWNEAESHLVKNKG